MDARKIAAQFAAYTWIENMQEGQVNEKAKARFATENWKPFLSIAPEGLGRLLIKIGAGQTSKRKVLKPRSKMKLAAAG